MFRGSSRRLAVGYNISAEIFNREWSDHIGSSRERIIYPNSPEFGSASFVSASFSAIGGPWPSANKPIAVPFRVFKGMTVYQLGWRNGSGTMTDSFDIGIYDSSFNRKVSGGGTARSGVSSVQWVDVTDTYLTPGKYFLAGANNGITASNLVYASSSLAVTLLAGMGFQDSATNSYPLPDPLAGMVPVATFTGIPFMMIAARVPF